MKNISDQDKCCGCGACAQICPQNSIRIKQDQQGFWKAKCDLHECIQCGLCYHICPMNNTSSINNHYQTCYAAASLDMEIYEKGSSGGVFPLLARRTIMENGFVWGCGYSSDLLPTHKGINTLKDLDDLCRSKYVQSYLGNSYSNIKKQLAAGHTVLFCGTPCQVAGLKNYLKQDYDNLFLVDLVCHGVPSAGLFKKHIDYLEHKSGKKLTRYEFRKKTKDNTFYSYNYSYSDGTMKTAPYYKDPYFNAFYELTSLNDVCYECPYACAGRAGDMTIGDYEWGKDHHITFNKFQEISCIIINNAKGQKMLTWIMSEMQLEKTEWDWITERNKNLIRPTPRPVNSYDFYKQIEKRGYKNWADGYFKSFEYIKKTKLLREIIKIKRKILNQS